MKVTRVEDRDRIVHEWHDTTAKKEYDAIHSELATLRGRLINLRDKVK